MLLMLPLSAVISVSEEKQRLANHLKYFRETMNEEGPFTLSISESVLLMPNAFSPNGDGKVSYIMIQGDPENVDAQYRTEFSVKALTDAGVEVEELLKQRGDWDQAKAQQIAQDALNQYGDKIEVIFCNNDAMALGALQAPCS